MHGPQPDPAAATPPELLYHQTQLATLQGSRMDDFRQAVHYQVMGCVVIYQAAKLCMRPTAQRNRQ